MAAQIPSVKNHGSGPTEEGVCDRREDQLRQHVGLPSHMPPTSYANLETSRPYAGERTPQTSMVAAASHENRVGTQPPNNLARAQMSQNSYPQYHRPLVGGGGGGGYPSMTNPGYRQSPTATHPPGATAWPAGAEDPSDGHETGSISSVTSSSGAPQDILNCIQVLRQLGSDSNAAATVRQLEEQLSVTVKSDIEAKFIAWTRDVNLSI